MAKKKKTTIEVQGLVIHIDTVDEKDFINITDIAKKSDRNLPKLLSSCRQLG